MSEAAALIQISELDREAIYLTLLGSENNDHHNLWGCGITIYGL